MLYDFISESVSLQEQELLEDKMVKYNGELSPKFGWCVIYMGGGASGKSTATKFLSRLQGRVFNVDDWKEDKNFWKIINPDTGDTYEAGFKTPEDRRDLGDSEFVSELHNTFSKSTKKVKNQILNNKASNSERLPNIIFDMTGDNLKKISEIVDTVKPQGYKVAIIWVLNTFEQAKKNIMQRERKGSPELVAAKHRDVLDTAKKIFSYGYYKNLDEFWVIDAYTYTRNDPVAYHDAPNVYHIPLTDDGLYEFAQVVKLIDSTDSQLKNYYSET